MPDWTELVERVHVVALPLRARFRGIDSRETMLLRGPAGWTEFAPFVEYDDAEAADWLTAAIEYGWNLELRTSVERVRVNATVPAVDANDVPRILDRFEGCRTAKVKVASGPLDEDVARVRAARDVLGAEGRIRIDANGAWTVDEAERAIRRLAPCDLEYIEQPCASVAELAQLRERIADLGIDIAADESVRRAEDPLAVARLGAADLLVIKAAPLGGITRAKTIITEAGLPVVVSSALESSVGLGMGAMLASQLDSPADCGLGTAELFTRDVCSRPRLVRDGHIETRRLIPDEERLAQLSVSPERETWWRERLRRCYEVMTDLVRA